MSSSIRNEITDPRLQKIRDTQRDAWNRSSVGWKQWDEVMMAFLKPIGDAMIRQMQLQPNDDVLDVASGTGEPGLTIASLVYPGTVTATDLSANMLAVANEHAQRNQRINFESVECDVSALPFDDNRFDAVSCRLGLMFFPDIEQSMREMVRVLQPGGLLSIAVWHEATRNPWITTSMNTMINMLNLQPPSPDAPGLFRCADDRQLIDLFSRHGLQDPVITFVEHNLAFNSFDHYWQFVSDVASPTAYKQADDITKANIKSALQDSIREQCGDGPVRLPSCAIVISGVK